VLTTDHAPFSAHFHVQRFTNAAYFAAPLFEESFGSPFPVPPPHIEPGWAQFVAFYRWPDDRLEPVGFCNYLPFEGVWLEGGLCVRRTFYARLPQSHSDECRAAGGVAQLIMEHAARELNECDAWFAYIGDDRSLKVCTRIGYEPTDKKYVMVKWFRDVPDDRRTELVDRISQLGPF
jgi:hypothetical protein